MRKKYMGEIDSFRNWVRELEKNEETIEDVKAELRRDTETRAKRRRNG